jgi:hypothetical protein
MFALLSVPISCTLGRKFGQPRTFGTLMMVFSVANVLTSQDPLTSPVGHWVYVLILCHCRIDQS